MSSSRSNRLWNSFQFLALCVFIVAVIEPSDADPDSNCKGKVCQKDPCENKSCRNGRCFLNGKDSGCLCQKGYAGKNCEKPICEAYPCSSIGSQCAGVGNVRKCVCGLGKLLSTLTGINLQLYKCKGDSDIEVEECNENPCLNGGTCYQSKQNAYCTCPTGWQGLDCSTRTEESSGGNTGSKSVSSGSGSGSGSSGSSSDSAGYCTPNPCVHGSCTVSESSYTCTCEAGFQGRNCDQGQAPISGSSKASSDLCVSNPCVNGECSTSGTSYQCQCDPGWVGQNCDKQDYCHSQPCVHGTCNNGDSSYTCTCQPGYVGTNCDTQDYCYSQSCGHGTCNNGVSSYTCTCQPGYVGANCDTQDYCYSQPCVHGTCNNGASSYTCTCQTGYVGTNCDTSNGGCASNPCQNGGTCVPGINGGFECKCVYPPWFETLCDTRAGEM